MRRSAPYFVVFALAFALAGCQRPGQNVYSASEVGRAQAVNFATVISVREVAIKGEQSGLGLGAGAAAGGIAGSQFGRSGGNVAATLGGVLIGGAVGAVAEQAIADRGGLEYVLTTQNGQTITIVQERNQGDRIIQPGERVMLQTTGRTQRVLPADNLPTAIRRPQGITVID